MSAQEVHLPETTQAKLAEFQTQVRKIKIAEGILSSLFGLMVSWVMVFSIDRFVDTAPVVRAVILAAGTLGIGLFFPLKCHRWVWGTRTMHQVARLLSHRYPNLGDQLLGVVELAQGTRNPGESYALATAAVEQVDVAVRDRNFRDAIPKPRSQQWAIATAIPAFLLLISVVLVPEAAWNAVGRWLMPWRDIDRFTFAQIEKLPTEIVIPHGEEFQLTARLRKKTQWSPESGKIMLRGQPNIETSQKAQAYDFSLPPLITDEALKVRIGDFRETVAVRPVTRPELTAITASVTLPEYLQYTKKQTKDVRGGAVSVVKGASIAFEAEVSRGLKDAMVSSGSASVNGSTIRTSGLTVEQSSTLRFEWTDNLGLSSQEPFPLNIRAVEDREPQVSCIQNDPLYVVLSTDVITFSLNASDDFGLKSTGLEWTGILHPLFNPSPDTADKVIQAGGPEERSISTRATFCAKSDRVRPQSLKMRAWAEDYNPERGRVYSAAIVLHVLSPEDHAVWMSEQLRRWTSQADDIYEQEMRLHDVNRELRRMDAAELQTQENQRRVRQQASSERANARRLSQITNQGDQLIEQALRNPEMLAGHLETFAQALKQLRGIAEKKMPSVAGMLTDAIELKRPQPPEHRSPLSNNSRSGPMAGNDHSTPIGKTGTDRQKQTKDPIVPALMDRESGFNPQPPGDKNEQKPKDSPTSSPSLGLPTTTLQGGPKSDKKEQRPKIHPKVDQAVEEQTGLLADFTKVRDDLQKIMDDLDNSTFVKRLKSASRRQLKMADDLNRTLFKNFGVSSVQLKEREREQSEQIAVREEKESQSVWLIKSDIEAYYSRRKEEKFRRIADEMAETGIVGNLDQLGNRVRSNLSGDSISRVEFWADTLDRWAEELVSPSKSGASRESKGDSLPPAIVLEVMRILEGEIDLRDETRAAETARTAVDKLDYEKSVARLFETQSSLHERVIVVMDDIRAIPNGDHKYGKELNIIDLTATAMKDAADLLSLVTTDSSVIAAETEAIELLLQSKRSSSMGGGGGGDSSPGGGGGGDTQAVALALHGPSADSSAHIVSRDVRQATGTTNDQLPAEFRDGLEEFFSAVENRN
ncbi:MAG: hypothetical protein MK102_08795 [Fuerstiella sp.]|nr:hypothetical protein [Fuerstiella sp.]